MILKEGLIQAFKCNLVFQLNTVLKDDKVLFLNPDSIEDLVFPLL